MEEKKQVDLEMVLWLEKHIHNPCVEPITGQNIREFYIKEAERLLRYGDMELILRDYLAMVVRRYKTV